MKQSFVFNDSLYSPYFRFCLLSAEHLKLHFLMLFLSKNLFITNQCEFLAPFLSFEVMKFTHLLKVMVKMHFSSGNNKVKV